MKDHNPDRGDLRPWGPASLGAYSVTPHDTNQLPTRPLYLRVNADGVLRMRWLDSGGNITSDVTEDVVKGEIINARPHVIHTDTDAEITAYF